MPHRTAGASALMDALMDALKHAPLFTGLDDAQLAEVATLFKVKDVTTDDRFIEYNTASAELFIVLSGKVEVHIPMAPRLEVNAEFKQEEKQRLQTAGRHAKTVVAVLGHGDSVGEFALLRDARRTASARALEDSRLARVYCADLHRFFEKETAIGYRVMCNLGRILVERLSGTNAQLRDALEKG